MDISGEEYGVKRVNIVRDASAMDLDDLCDMMRGEERSSSFCCRLYIIINTLGLALALSLNYIMIIVSII